MDAKVYVGDLGSSASKQDLEDSFSYYGPLRNVWVARNPPGFAFVEFEDNRDAEDAIRGLDGRSICGRRVRVEMSAGNRNRGRAPPPRRSRPFNPEDRCYECGDRGHYARDCTKPQQQQQRSRSPRRPKKRSYSRSYSRSRSRSRDRRSRNRSYSKEKSHSPSRERSRERKYRRSKSPAQNGGRRDGSEHGSVKNDSPRND